MKKQKTKKRKSAFHINRENITKNYIDSLKVIDSYEHLRLLKDSKKRLYVVFNNYSRNSLFSKDYYFAREFFEKQANKLD